ncbi:MAG: restriction endonuclease, partial [Candidatus Taylorbacteria bacterium]|nr:restriction endonuclease [Candidatus Taylorbacteria bacterium]
MAHAQQVKDELNKIKGNEEYATRIVSEDKDDMTKFRDKEMPMPVIATTVDLLSTGIDIPHLQNIVFMRPIASKVLFKQIIGRGARLFEGKGFFRIIDFTNATRLIDNWDLPPEGTPPPPPPEEPKEPYDKLLKAIIIDNKSEEPVSAVNFKVKISRWEKNGASDNNGIIKTFGLPSNEQLYLRLEKDGYKNLSKRFKPQVSDEATPYEFRLKPQRTTAKKII